MLAFTVRTCIADSQAKIGDGVARSYVVTVDRAWGLAKADRFGKADPFISVKVAMQLRSVWPLNVCTTVRAQPPKGATLPKIALPSGDRFSVAAHSVTMNSSCSSAQRTSQNLAHQKTRRVGLACTFLLYVCLSWSRWARLRFRLDTSTCKASTWCT